MMNTWDMVKWMSEANEVFNVQVRLEICSISFIPHIGPCFDLHLGDSTLHPRHSITLLSSWRV